MDRSNFRGVDGGVKQAHARGRTHAKRNRTCHEGGYESRANALRRVLNPTTLNRMHEK